MVDSPRITHVEFGPSHHGGSTLADLRWSTTRPGALCSFLSWPQELEVRASTQNSELFTERIIFKNAGESRMVYVSADGRMAFKIADNSGKYNRNDNKSEDDAALPSWLVPKVIGYDDKVIFRGLRVSVLIVQGCSETLLALATPARGDVDMERRFRRYVNAVANTFEIMARAGAETKHKYSDWNIGNIMTLDCSENPEVRLVDYADTQELILKERLSHSSATHPVPPRPAHSPFSAPSVPLAFSKKSQPSAPLARSAYSPCFSPWVPFGFSKNVLWVPGSLGPLLRPFDYKKRH